MLKRRKSELTFSNAMAGMSLAEHEKMLFDFCKQRQVPSETAIRRWRNAQSGNHEDLSFMDIDPDIENDLADDIR